MTSLAQFESPDSESPDSRFRIADSVLLSQALLQGVAFAGVHVLR